jgi:hypothetical protein
VTPEEIRPVPKNRLRNVTTRRQRSKKSEILTSTPIKNQLEEINARKKEIAAKKKEKAIQKKLREEKKQSKIKETKELKKKSKVVSKKSKNPKPKVNKKLDFDESFTIQVPKPPKDPETEPTEEDYPCLICQSTVSESKETWLCYNMCEKWAHEACTYELYRHRFLCMRFLPRIVIDTLIS